VFDFETLDSLPTYGPMAIPFSASGHGTHREGFVIRVVPSNGRSWVGNFQPGYGPLTTALRHPNDRSLVVVAAGQAYIVDPETAVLDDSFGADLVSVLESQVPHTLVLVGFTRLKVLTATGLWTTPRLSWDGFADVRVDGSTVLGNAWEPGDDVFLPFTVDLVSRAVTGGSYPSEKIK